MKIAGFVNPLRPLFCLREPAATRNFDENQEEILKESPIAVAN
jgi:hypothetical protein